MPNFWGPAVQTAMQEPYIEATGGTRLVQYFDKARMEQTTAGGPITNGLLTVELITGQRQMGDHSFAAFPPSSLPVVGDLTNPWPPYAALRGTVFAARVAKSGEPVGTVYKPDGTFALNPGLAAQPGAAFGDYQTDPGGVYAHNIPLAFSTYLAALPLPWQGAMGFPLTEAFWVNVKVNGALTWVLVQPFERRVLSYTPTNPARFQVEMGNIGQHYYQWRYPTDAATGDISSTTTTTATTSSTTAATTRTTGTPGALAIAAVQLGAATSTTFSLTFTTSVAATTAMLYGTASHSYEFQQDVSTSATQNHTVTLVGLQPGTKYYFALRATANGASVERKEDYFATPKTDDQQATMSSTPTKVTHVATAIATVTPKATATPTTNVVQTIAVTVVQASVNARNPVQLAPSALLLDHTTIAVSLTYEGNAGGTTSTLRPTAWSHDAAGLSASSTDALPSLTLLDKQSTVILAATITIPRADASAPPLIVSYTRKMLASEYGAGLTFTTTPLSSAQSPGYNLTLSFSIVIR
ncbi:MAG: fibronectin type III domain-containing protein [Thermomicrobiales bacterium]